MAFLFIIRVSSPAFDPRLMMLLWVSLSKPAFLYIEYIEVPPLDFDLNIFFLLFGDFPLPDLGERLCGLKCLSIPAVKIFFLILIFYV